MEKNILEILAIVESIIITIYLIVRATPTQKDDIKLKEIAGKKDKIMRVLEIILLSSKKKDK